MPTAVRDRESRPLARFPVTCTTCPDEARDAVSRVYVPHELTAAGGRVDMALNAYADRVLTLGHLGYGAEALLSMPPAEDCYHVALTTAGSTDADRTDGARERTVAGERGLVLSPVQHNTLRWTPDAEQLVLKVTRTRLEDHLGELLGRPVTEVLDFGLGLDLTTGPGRGLLRAVRFLADELDRPDGLAELPLAREQLEAFVMTQLLHAGRHQFSDVLRAPAEGARAGRLAPVVEYMRTHADEALTPQDLASVACMSVRTLHASFQQTFGVPPMAYLRRLRLDLVRAELLRGDRDRVRVTDVAVRWGFFHQSRFAQQYRECFGELPSRTLRA